jgi:hypothetical protein
LTPGKGKITSFFKPKTPVDDKKTNEKSVKKRSRSPDAGVIDIRGSTVKAGDTGKGKRVKTESVK